MNVVKCGTCIGCEIDAAVAEAVAEIDSLLMPKIAALEVKRSGLIKFYQWRGRDALEDEVRPVAQEIRMLHEQRGRFVADAIAIFKPIGCVQIKIVLEPGEAIT